MARRAHLGAYVAGLSMTLGVFAGPVSGYYAATLTDDAEKSPVLAENRYSEFS